MSLQGSLGRSRRASRGVVPWTAGKPSCANDSKPTRLRRERLSIVGGGSSRVGAEAGPASHRRRSVAVAVARVAPRCRRHGHASVSRGERENYPDGVFGHWTPTSPGRGDVRACASVMDRLADAVIGVQILAGHRAAVSPEFRAYEGGARAGQKVAPRDQCRAGSSPRRRHSRIVVAHQVSSLPMVELMVLVQSAMTC